jgi:subtilisin-like proprotein convertase family protein
MRKGLAVGLGLCVLFVTVVVAAFPPGSLLAAKQGPYSAPPPPAGCAPATRTFTNATPLPIVDGGVASSTIAVAGVGGYLWDLDITTLLAHTFPTDLDITVQSPQGTVVTLSTDNGSGHDNVFHGTLWDDDANPGGQVPYVANYGLTTDHPYINLSLASSLAPEEPLAAFRGENPNGTWTITISDDVIGDAGSLDSWSLTLATLAAAPTQVVTTFSNSTPVPIADVAVASSTIPVAGLANRTSKVTLQTTITHTFAADLDITLQSPAGTVVTLSTDNGAGNDNVFNGTVWDDNANPGGQVPYTTNSGVTTDHVYVNLTLASPLAPEESLGAFVGENANGTWTLTVSDDLPGDTGTIASWSLFITTATCTVPGIPLVDFDGDRTTDWAVTRTGSLIWHILNGGGYTGVAFGDDTQDIRVPGDYDGDGKTDVAVWRPSNATFYVLRSSNGAVMAQQWGQNGDDPRIVGDYDGDGKDDFAVYRSGAPSTWFVLRSSNGTFFATAFGQTGDKPAPGDYDGDGKADLAIARGPGAATFFIEQTSAGFVAIAWGVITDSILSGDYDGDRKSDIGVARQVSGSWEHYVRRSSDGSFYGQVWGLATDVLTPGDFDGDGKTDFATWRPAPAPSTFFALRSTNGALMAQAWGLSTDFPVPFFIVH